MIRRGIRAMAMTSLMIPWLASGAQDSTHAVQLADRGPRFLSPATRTTPAEDASHAPVLARRVTLELNRVALGDALSAITRQTGVRFVYGAGSIPVDHPISLSASDLTVGAALYDILFDLNIDVHVVKGDLLTLVPRVSTRYQPGGATVTGYVRDSATGTPIPQVSVHVDGTQLEGKTGANGAYKIVGVTPGDYRLTARRVGYLATTHAVTLAEGDTKAVNFALSLPANKLDEVVTTAVGVQRRYAVGNVISTINVDSLAPTAPVTSVTDLISARAPGVEVLENSGLVGSGETIRIRGVSSLVLQGDPIVIVDGIRQDNTAGGALGLLTGQTNIAGVHPTPSRINDINFDDIATIDVLKGPAASTEYGTDAANGVIVITTKHGSTGSPVWHVDGENTASTLPTAYPKTYYSWGHLTNGTGTAANCTLAYYPAWGGGTSTSGNCTVDSITQFNPLNDASTTIFGTGLRQKGDLSVSGGSDAIRYFVEGGVSNENGIIRLPDVYHTLADTAGVVLPAAAYKSNIEQQQSIRLNTAIKLSETADLNLNVSYLSTFSQSPDARFLLFGPEIVPATDSPSNGWGYIFSFDNGQSPFNELSQIGVDNSTSFTGGATANWRPMSWLVGHATVGIDHGSDGQRSTDYPIGNVPNYNNGFTQLAVGSSTNDIYTVDLRAAATAAVTRQIQAVTSVGLQLADTRAVGQGANVYNITLANLTLDGYPNASVSEQTNRAATLGGYGEEQLSFANRLFLIGAVRIDGASGFGSQYAIAAYPKLSASWLVLDNGRTTVRLRGAMGEAGVQPQNGASQLLYNAAPIYTNGSIVTAQQIEWPGNDQLRPERSEEYEGGVDLGTWNNRLSVEFTLYQKTTHDALIDQTLGGDVCCYTYQQNIGEISNGGVEVSATVGLIQSRDVNWNVSINASENHNKLVSLAPGVQVTANGILGSSAPNENRVGYPLYGLWGPVISYKDANHDGIIETNEFTSSDTSVYFGPGAPTQEASLSSYLGLWRGMITLAGLFDYRGGYRIWNDAAVGYEQIGQAREANFPDAPQWLQARTVTNNNFACYAGCNLYLEDGTMLRFREVSLTYALPRSLAHHLRMVETLSLTGAVRNIALWTRYSGMDPEVTNAVNLNNMSYATPTGQAVVNNNIRSDAGAVPLLRDWVLRLNVGLK